MNETLFQVPFFHHVLFVTGWKLVGYAGILMFTGRWLVQVAASRARQRSHVPRLFWYMSLAGSFLLLAYFTLGRNDSVGILSNLFPCLVAAYNLRLDLRHRRAERLAASASG
jgi:lipid-A-disaccharide synthase-like uncharacterized protein